MSNSPQTVEPKELLNEIAVLFGRYNMLTDTETDDLVEGSRGDVKIVLNKRRVTLSYRANGNGGPRISYEWSRKDLRQLKHPSEQDQGLGGDTKTLSEDLLDQPAPYSMRELSRVAFTRQPLSVVRQLLAQESEAIRAARDTQAADRDLVQRAANEVFRAQADSGVDHFAPVDLSQRQPRWAGQTLQEFMGQEDRREDLKLFLEKAVQLLVPLEQQSAIQQLVVQFGNMIERPMDMFAVDRLVEHVYQLPVAQEGVVPVVKLLGYTLEQLGRQDVVAVYEEWLQPMVKEKLGHAVVVRVSLFLLAMLHKSLPGMTLSEQETVDQKQHDAELYAWRLVFSVEQTTKSRFETFLQEHLRHLRVEDRGAAYNKLKDLPADARPMLDFLNHCCLTTGTRLALPLYYLTANRVQLLDAVSALFDRHATERSTTEGGLQRLHQQFESLKLSGFLEYAHAWISASKGDSESRELRAKRLVLLCNGLLVGAMPRQNAALLNLHEVQISGDFVRDLREHFATYCNPEELYEPEGAPGLALAG